MPSADAFACKKFREWGTTQEKEGRTKGYSQQEDEEQTVNDAASIGSIKGLSR